ncbi:BgTH12-05600 [Blumeria graminis f. sp. triticale]|nr:BgTH12-05600 [Blumeria graminis f. sp. triticale]
MTAALRNELYKNVIVDLDNFWTELFLGKDWSNQTWNIWQSYEAYELKEIKIRQEDEIMRRKMDALKIQKEAETESQRETMNDKQRTKKEDEESANLAENESLESFQNIGNTNNNDSQNQINPTVAEPVVIQKIVYTNKILTEDMTEDEMWDWLGFFRKNFLNQLTDQFNTSSEKFPSIIKEAEGSQLRCNYFRSSDECRMRGTDHGYQVDFLTKRIRSSNAHRHMWHSDDIGSNYRAKKFSIWDFQLRILDNFSANFLGLKALASELREILFGENGKEYGTPDEHEPEYEKIIKAFNNTIEDLRGKIHP